MPIVFSAIVSHTPVLLERVGKGNRERLAATVESYAALERLLYAASPETLAVISPHGEIMPEAFGVGMADRFTARFEAFGDFSVQPSWRADAKTAQDVRASDESQRQSPPLALVTQPLMDHGVAVPAVLLTAHLPRVALLPLHVAGLPATSHWRFGQSLGQFFRSAARRIAVVASADLSHRLSEDAPAGFSPQAAAFDRQLLESIRRADAAAVVNLDEALVQAVACCGHLPIVTLLGVLDGMVATPTVMSYEGPFGVGHLMVGFELG